MDLGSRAVDFRTPPHTPHSTPPQTQITLKCQTYLSSALNYSLRQLILGQKYGLRNLGDRTGNIFGDDYLPLRIYEVY